MKRGFLFSIAVALPLFLALSSRLLPESRIAGAASFHQDPRSSLSITDAGLAVRLAGMMLGAVVLESTGNLQNLTALIREANLPPEIRLFASAVARLIQELHGVLSQLNITFSEIDRLNDLRDVKATREKLGTAQAQVQRGQQIIDDLTLTLNLLTNSVASFNRLLPEAAAELEQASLQLEEYWQRYLTRLVALEGTAATIAANTISTVLDFRSDQPSVFVGQSLPVSGTLTADGNGLGDKQIDFFLDGDPIGWTTTAADGSFAPQLQIPLRYTPEARLVARFAPERSEPPYYEGTSAQVIIRLSYYTTTLDLRTGQPSVFVGQSLPVSGALIADGNGLVDKQIDFFLDGEPIGSTTTTADGSFASQLQIPFRYTPEARLLARFVPERSGPPYYYEGTSAQVIIRLSYHTTTLTFEAPTSAYPGRPFTVKVNTAPLMPGAVTHDVTISVAGSPAGSGRCNGMCEIIVRVPDQAPLGAQRLGINASPSELYSGAEGSSTIAIVKSPVLLQLEATLLANVPGELHVAGSVSSLFGSQDTGQATLRLGNLSQSAPVANGKFTADLKIPSSVSIAGLQTLDVSYQPGLPWLAPAQQSRKVLVVNVMNISVLLVLLGLAGTIIITKRSSAGTFREVPHGAREFMTDPTYREEIGSPTPAPSRSKVVERYWQAVRFIEPVLGIIHAKSATLREFGSVVERHHKGVSVPLYRLTAVAEESLYSPRSPSVSQDEEAGQQLEEVRRSLRDA